MANVARFIADHVQARKENLMSVAGDAALAVPDTINFTLGDPDLTTDQQILEAMHTDVTAGKTHYTESLGEPEFREAICADVASRCGLTYTIDNCMVTTSANHAMWLILQTIINPGDEVLVIEPYFTPYPDQIEMAKGVPVFVPTTAENGFLPTREAIEAALTPRSRAVIVNTPTNPTGAIWDKATLDMVAEIACERDLIVLADDIYTIYDFARPWISIATCEGMQERTIILSSFSKDFCMAGFRLGYLLGPAEVMAAARDINENVVFSAPTPSQRAGLAALRLREEICPGIRETFLQRLTVAAQEVANTPKMHCQPPQGAIYLWVDVRETGLTSVEVAQQLFADAHVAVVPGSAFGTSGEGFIRLAVTIGEDEIREAFTRIRQMALFS